jgi:hypothetical protein
MVHDPHSEIYIWNFHTYIKDLTYWCKYNPFTDFLQHIFRMADDIEDIPRELLLKLMETSTKAANDNDKVYQSYK